MIVLLLYVTSVFSQDTSRLPGINKQVMNNKAKSNASAKGDTVNPIPARRSVHSEVNSNAGTNLPNTTSGTLNSTVNPNTQLAIPMHKRKKKINQSTPANK